MSSHMMTLLLTLMLSNSLLVVCLRCYVGLEGDVTQEVVENPSTHMCSYELRDPCTFSLPALYIIYAVEHNYERFCWDYNNRYVCSCRSELCNGNMKLMQETRASVFFPSNPPTDKQHPIPRDCELASDEGG
ncbi:hypothetical protein Y032_0011g1278 [Ancylostoma ceylanicum]|uniref:Post-SET domain-containing protein n=1 Tax=Ancylostoma ceylanicum TaxID=53326 RepID=A0A016VE90_9BILA|nr:hypothetical protein Y032_0011g1278 [Ancylostoma ceylanicum]